MPAFSVVSLPQMLAMAGPALRTAKGTQSISGAGTGFDYDAGFTQAQFTARGPCAVTQDMIPVLKRVSKELPCYFVSQRNSTVFSQEELYEGIWTLRKMVSSGLDLRKYVVKRLPSRYWGWSLEVPGVDPRITNPLRCVPADILVSAARDFDNMVNRYWIGLMDSKDSSWMTPPTRHYICLLYTSPSPRDATLSRMPSSA